METLNNFILVCVALAYILYLGVIVFILIVILSPKFRKDMLEDWYRSSNKEN